MFPRRLAGLRGLLPAQKVDLPFLHELAVKASLIPESYDASHGWQRFGMLGNGPDPSLTINGGNPVGDCFFAAVAHGLIVKALVQIGTGYELHDGFTLPTANEWVGLYLGYQNGLQPGQTATDGPDNGTEPVAGFKWLTAAGLIKRWGLVHTSQLNQGTYTHAGVLLACALDEDADQEFGEHQPWQNLPQMIDPIAGGHAIYRAAYSPRFATEITWGADQLAAIGWERSHVQQAFWFQAPWEQDATGFDYAPLDAALTKV